MRWISFFILLAAVSAVAARAPTPEIDCGVYKFSGLLKMNNQHQFLIPFAMSVKLPKELLILASEKVDDSKNLTQHLGKYITFEAEVARPIMSNNQSFVIFKKMLTVETSKAARYQKIKNLECMSQ